MNDNDSPITRGCPGCGVAPSKPCLDASGRALTRFHQQRKNGANRSEAALETNRVWNRENYHAKKAAR